MMAADGVVSPATGNPEPPREVGMVFRNHPPFSPTSNPWFCWGFVAWFKRPGTFTFLDATGGEHPAQVSK